MTKITFPKNIRFTGSRYGLVFLNGKAETNNVFIIKHLISKGFVIENETSKVKPIDVKPVEKKLTDYVKKELLEIAKNEGLELDNKLTNPKIIEAIEENRKLVEDEKNKAIELDKIKKEAEELEIAIPEEATIEDIELLIQAKKLEDETK